MFITGQKVVCIDDKFTPHVLEYLIALPVEGKVYVVRGLAPGLNCEGGPDIAVYLVGLRNPLSNVAPFRERGFHCERFRPLDEVSGSETEYEMVTIRKTNG